MKARSTPASLSFKGHATKQATVKQSIAWLKLCDFVGYVRIESFRSENGKEDEYEFCPQEVWYFVFVLAFVLT